MNRKAIAVVVTILLAVTSLVFAMTWWPTTLPKISTLDVVSPKGTTAAVTDKIIITSWNLHGMLHGKNANPTLAAASEVRQRAQDISATLTRISPDIILLQGVDFGASRSSDVDEEALLTTALAAFPHHACAPLVDAPSPFGVGRTGVCIFSRYPLLSHQRHLQFASTSFTPVPGGQIVDVAIGSRRYRIGNFAVQTEKDVDLLPLGLTTSAPTNSSDSQPRLLFSGVAVDVDANQSAPKDADVLSILPAASSSTWPSSQPTQRRQLFFVQSRNLLADMRVVLNAGEAAAELPVMVRLLLPSDTAKSP